MALGSSSTVHRRVAKTKKVGYKANRRSFSHFLKVGNCRAALDTLLGTAEFRQAMTEHAVSARSQRRQPSALVRQRGTFALIKMQQQFLRVCVVAPR